MAAQAPTEPGAGEMEGASELPPAEFEPGLDTRPPPIPVSDEDAASARKTLQEHLETDEYKHLQQAAAVTVDDACIRRYMVAKRQSVDAAVRGILATLQWRMDTIPDPLQCTTCCTTPSSHCFEFVGHDWFGRPVVYGCPTRASNLTTEPTVQHVVSVCVAAGTDCVSADVIACDLRPPSHRLEAAFSHPDSAATWVWITDFNNYGMWDAMQGTSLAAAFAKTFSAHYPERLGVILLMQPPGAFSVLLNVVRAVADPRTVNKVVEVSAPTHAERMTRLRAMLGSGPAVQWVDKALATALDAQLPQAPEGFPLAHEWGTAASASGGEAGEPVAESKPDTSG